MADNMSLDDLTITAEFEDTLEQNKPTINFAHPIDGAITGALDRPKIKAVFSKIVDIIVDTNYRLQLASGVKISESYYPEIYAVIKECAGVLNIPVPYVIISSSIEGINACTSGTDKFAFIALSNLLALMMNKEEKKFIIGHECGHLALGHVIYHTAVSTFGNLGSLIPLIGPVVAGSITYPLKAWSRRSEISADRAGLLCCKDINIAKRTLLKLEAGLAGIDNVDIENYLANSRDMMDISKIGKYRELFLNHPIIPKRIEALDLFYKSEKYYRISGTSKPEGLTLLKDQELEDITNKTIKVIL